MKKKQTPIKSKSLFDHINHIRKVQSKTYFEKLSDADKKTFNHYMIVRILSMDEDIIEEANILSKYFDKIPSEQFYDLLINLIPKTNKFSKYIKPKKQDVDEHIISCLCKKFQLGKKDVLDYYNIICNYKNGIEEIKNILSDFGYDEKQIKKII